MVESYTEQLTFTAASLTSFFIRPFPKWRELMSIHELSFNTPYEIPASIVQESATDETSFIEMEYSATNPTDIENDLGMGITGEQMIPCKSLRGLSPIVGNEVNCTLITGPNPKIRIENFEEIPKGENIFVVIPNVKNPRDTWTVQTSVVIKQNRIYKILSQGTASFTSNANTQSNYIISSFFFIKRIY